MTFPTPILAAVGSATAYYDQRIAQLLEQDRNARAMCEAGANLLNALFPGNRPHVKAFADAISAFICSGTEEQVQQLKDGRATAVVYTGPTDEERLVQLVAERDEEQAKIDRFDEALKELPEGMEAFGEIIRATGINAFYSSLEWKQKEISALQERIERTAREADNPERPATPERDKTEERSQA